MRLDGNIKIRLFIGWGCLPGFLRLSQFLMAVGFLWFSMSSAWASPGVTILESAHGVLTAGKHTLKIRAMDPGVAVDRVYLPHK